VPFLCVTTNLLPNSRIHRQTDHSFVNSTITFETEMLRVVTLLIFCALNTVVHAQNFTLSGYVKDSTSRETIAKAQVAITLNTTPPKGTSRCHQWLWLL
jgi:hypothetical protein